MYLDESELLVNVSLLLLSSPSLLFLFGTNLSLAFPFLNPPWNAALACIDMSIKEASQHKQTQIPDQNLHMNMILVKSFFFPDSWPFLLLTVSCSCGDSDGQKMERSRISQKWKAKTWFEERSSDKIFKTGWGRQSNFIRENKTKQKQATWEVLRLIQAWQWVQ